MAVRGLLFGVENYLQKATQETAAHAVHLQPQYTNNPQNICEGVITNALQSLMQVPDSFTDVLRVVSVLCLYNELASCLLGCLMQLVFNTKANLSQPQSLQFVCNQGNHSVVKTTFVVLCN